MSDDKPRVCTEHLHERAHLCYRSEPCPWCEIARLRAENDSLREGSRVDFEARDRMLQRIEALENSRFELLDQISALSGEEDFYVITEEQIDKAWEQRYHIDGIGDGQPLIRADLLHVVACKKCGGSGKTESRTGSMKEEPMLWSCKDCYGHGWVWSKK
jgi:hypothetical protein